MFSHSVQKLGQAAYVAVTKRVRTNNLSAILKCFGFKTKLRHSDFSARIMKIFLPESGIGHCYYKHILKVKAQSNFSSGYRMWFLLSDVNGFAIEEVIELYSSKWRKVVWKSISLPKKYSKREREKQTANLRVMS